MVPITFTAFARSFAKCTKLRIENTHCYIKTVTMGIKKTGADNHKNYHKHRFWESERFKNQNQNRKN